MQGATASFDVLRVQTKRPTISVWDWNAGRAQHSPRGIGPYVGPLVGVLWFLLISVTVV